jgi:hypothetical protein
MYNIQCTASKSQLFAREWGGGSKHFVLLCKFFYKISLQNLFKKGRFEYFFETAETNPQIQVIFLSFLRYI